MSSIERFYNTAISGKRMTWENESSAEVSITPFSGHIQQAKPEFSEHIGEAWGQTFIIFCSDATDVAAGDTLTIASGEYAGDYSVKNIQVNSTGNNKHYELTAIKDIE